MEQMPRPAKKTNTKKQTGAAVIKSPDVQEMAEDLIERYHHKLRSAKIAWGFSTRPAKLFGNVIRVPEAFRVLAERGTHFLVVVNKGRWDGLNHRERQAAVDELLCSMSFDEMTPRIEAPDFRGYRANILRFGATTADLERAFRGCQLTLPGTEDVERELAPPPECDACGDPAVGGHKRTVDDAPLCEACWKWLMGENDPDSSNADDEGAHCEGCGAWGREGRLREQADCRLLCWKCERANAAGEGSEPAAEFPGDESPLAGMTVTMFADGKSVEMTGEQFESGLDRIASMTPEEIAAFADGDVPGVDFTEHETDPATAGVA